MWKSININKQNIKAETAGAYLIAMPHNSGFDGYCFWHPAKLIRSGLRSYTISLAYNNDFIFNLKKYGKGKYNKNKVIDEQAISVEEFEEAFEVMDESNTKNMLIFETHKPEHLEAKKIEALDELKDE